MLFSQLRQRSPLALDEATWRALELAYQTPPRAYHDATHLIELVGHYDWVAERVGWRRGPEVFAAMLYHDAIYRPGEADNERKSADLARRALAGTGLDLDRVAELILATAHHGKDGVVADPDADPDLTMFLDADMAILGASPERFSQYERQIATEFAQIPPDLFAIGRRAFLNRCLAMPRIYRSALFHAQFEAAARENLERAVRVDPVG